VYPAVPVRPPGDGRSPAGYRAGDDAPDASPDRRRGLSAVPAGGGVVVVRPGDGQRLGNVEFLARSDDTPRFNLALVTIQPGRDGPPAHAHEGEDDAFYLLDGELVFQADGDEIVAGPGTFVLVPPGVRHTFSNPGAVPARFLNVHAPAGFDLRLAEG